MTDKSSREDVARVIVEPVAIVYVREEKTPSEHGRFTSWLINPVGIHNGTKLYTEAQLLAMYASGAEAMRERAAVRFSNTTGAHFCAEIIRALPITTNTEGERANG
ncbi:MAG: hypothetical protein WC710_15255 [Gallionella sp.]|jgi:hypothetical protein